MQEQTILKIFGTGQITIPKEWRISFGADSVKAIFDRENKKISLNPIKLVELEDSSWVSTKQLSEDLNETKMSDIFKKELLAGYEKSDFYKKGLKSNSK